MDQPLSVLSRLASRWREIALIFASTVFAYLVAEAGYRVWQYLTLPDRLYAIVSANSSAGQNSYAFDPHTGYRYPPNFEGRRGPPWNSRWRTNSHGHVSKFEYPKEKPAGEYRIAVIGDSFTANITNNVRWTEVLEELLNADTSWRARVGGKFTRVINFGVDGMGMVQFGRMLRYHAMEFSPDFVIVNFISDDLRRRLRYPEPGMIGANREQVLRDYVRRKMLDSIDWFRIYPELIAATVGPKLGMTARIPLDAKLIAARETGEFFANRQEAIHASAVAIDDMLKVHPRILYLQAPLFHEMRNESPGTVGLLEELQKAAPQAKIVSMRATMESLLVGKRDFTNPDFKGLGLLQILALPRDKWPEICTWFYLPEDVHYSDYGTTLYAKQVARYLIENPPR